MMVAYNISGRVWCEFLFVCLFLLVRCSAQCSLLLANGNINRWTKLCISRMNPVAVQWHNQCWTHWKCGLISILRWISCSIAALCLLSNWTCCYIAKYFFFIVLERERTPKKIMNEQNCTTVNRWLVYGICCWCSCCGVHIFLWLLLGELDHHAHDSVAEHIGGTIWLHIQL